MHRIQSSNLSLSLLKCCEVRVIFLRVIYALDPGSSGKTSMLAYADVLLIWGTWDELND